MKNLKNKVNLNLLSGITKLVAVVLFGGAAFMFSINHANANDTKTFNFPDKITNKDIDDIQSNGNGKYKIEMTSVTYGNSSTYVYFMVYDTSSGRSKLYYIEGNKAMNSFDSKWQLPSQPL